MPDLVTFVAIYFYSLKWIFIAIACCMLVFAIDDLFVDVSYWLLRIRRIGFSGRKKNNLALTVPTKAMLCAKKEKPLAIMVPAWKEIGVVGAMAKLLIETLDYENYQIFIGTYPNDPDTQREVDSVCRLYPNIHKVVCTRPGPTCKADCLNNILVAINQFEELAKVKFSGVILHDSEDVVSEYELRLYNYMLETHGFIQIPVYPFVREWYQFTSGHYADEFAELHGKDVVVRDKVSGQVPSAGVGTCFSRNAIAILKRENSGIAFNTESLTEDYDIGFRLKELGIKETFVRCPVAKEQGKRSHQLEDREDARNIICVREFFPDTMNTAVRQKSRWIVGIVFQGYKSLGWTKNVALNYFLWRDRRGGITNILGFLALIVVLNLSVLSLYEYLSPDGYRFLANFASGDVVKMLVFCNLFFLLLRCFHRFYFVNQYYGLFQGVLSLPRMVWGNVINFFACMRAIKLVVSASKVATVPWDKTTHQFPQVNSGKADDVDVVKGIPGFTSEWINEWEKKSPLGLSIYQYLIYTGRVTQKYVAALKAKHAGVSVIDFDFRKVDRSTIDIFGPLLAWKYSVVPVFASDEKITIASEDWLPLTTITAISRATGLAVNYGIAPPGYVAAALNAWYGEAKSEILVRTDAGGMELEPSFSRVLLRDFLVRAKIVHPSVIAQLVIEFDQENFDLSEALVSRGIVLISDMEKYKSNVSDLANLRAADSWSVIQRRYVKTI